MTDIRSLWAPSIAIGVRAALILFVSGAQAAEFIPLGGIHDPPGATD